MDAGTGKTRAAMELISSTSCDKVVWVAPLRTLSNVRAEISKWGGIDKKKRFCIMVLRALGSPIEFICKYMQR